MRVRKLILGVCTPASHVPTEQRMISHFPFPTPRQHSRESLQIWYSTHSRWAGCIFFYSQGSVHLWFLAPRGAEIGMTIWVHACVEYMGGVRGGVMWAERPRKHWSEMHCPPLLLYRAAHMQGGVWRSVTLGPGCGCLYIWSPPRASRLRGTTLLCCCHCLGVLPPPSPPPSLSPPSSPSVSLFWSLKGSSFELPVLNSSNIYQIPTRYVCLCWEACWWGILCFLALWGLKPLHS